MKKLSKRDLLRFDAAKSAVEREAILSGFAPYDVLLDRAIARQNETAAWEAEIADDIGHDDSYRASGEKVYRRVCGHTAFVLGCDACNAARAAGDPPEGRPVYCRDEIFPLNNHGRPCPQPSYRDGRCEDHYWKLQAALREREQERAAFEAGL